MVWQIIGWAAGVLLALYCWLAGAVVLWVVGNGLGGRDERLVGIGLWIVAAALSYVLYVYAPFHIIWGTT